MALPFTMLEAYLYAISGQQAYDTYYENEENQEALHKDFCDFLSETESGIQFNMKVNGAMAVMTMDKFIEFYKTYGSSALAGANEKTANNLRVIMGGGNSDDNNDDNEDNTKLVGIGGATGTATINKIIGDYISALTNGERGEVSETFMNGGQNVPPQYFDGDYLIIDNELYFRIWGDFLETHKYASNFKYYTGLNELKIHKPFNMPASTVSYISFFVDTLGANYDDYNYDDYLDIQVYGLVDGEVTSIYRLGRDTTYSNYRNCTYINKGGTFEMAQQHIMLKVSALPCVSGVPVFITKESMEYYMNTGDASGAINYFEGFKPNENWYDFDFSAITDKLDELLQALNNLPLITTDSLAGFAQGVNNGAVAGQLPQADPMAQQKTMEDLLRDNAKKVVTEQLSDSSLAETEKDLSEQYGATPKPTFTPEQNVTKKQAQMMVDLHEFFPFCVPYDLIHLIKVLNAEPVAPCFETALVYEPLGINVPIKLDLAPFEDVAKVFRITETAFFILALILVSRSLIRG